ncbi:hypothetical protein FRC17_000899 [Serendipita sp. 399]|nr:hypothetical protein FRC17_000899 [Serendipita sp. 399]
MAERTVENNSNKGPTSPTAAQLVVGPLISRSLERKDLSDGRSRLVPITSLQPGVLDYLIAWRSSHISTVKATFLASNSKKSFGSPSRLPKEFKEYLEKIPDRPNWTKTGYVDTKELPPFVRYNLEKRDEDGKEVEVLLIPIDSDWKEKEVKLEEVDLELAKQVLEQQRPLTAEEKEEVLRRFRDGQLHVVKSFRATPLGAALVGGLAGGSLGLVGSALQNAVQKHSHGWKGIFTRTGSTISGFALAGSTYGLVDAFLKEQRRTDDALGKFAAGCAAGFMLGIKGKSIPTALGSCVFLGAPVALLQVQGGSLRGDGQYEYTSLGGQQAQRLRGMFRPVPSTTASKETMKTGEEKEEHAHGHEGDSKAKIMSPLLRRILSTKE